MLNDVLYDLALDQANTRQYVKAFILREIFRKINQVVKKILFKRSHSVEMLTSQLFIWHSLFILKFVPSILKYQSQTLPKKFLCLAFLGKNVWREPVLVCFVIDILRHNLSNQSKVPTIHVDIIGFTQRAEMIPVNSWIGLNLHSNLPLANYLKYVTFDI